MRVASRGPMRVQLSHSLSVGTTIPQSVDNNNPENDGPSHKGTVHHPESSSTCVRLGLLLQKGGGNEHAGKMLKEPP